MYIIIPSYEPDQRLIDVVNSVTQELKATIIVVNDGSTSQYDRFFDEAKQLGATVLTHPNNKGKGAALKTAFRYIKDQDTTDIMITVDSDGQHLIQDIIRVAEATQSNKNSIVLGARAFVGKVPARSRFGNKTTALLFKLATGQAITDTQTGLRGFSTTIIDWLLSLDGERFEYEFNILLEANRAGIHLEEVPIETVYLEDNKSSHFRPIQDSIRIYAPFITFIFNASAAGIVDACLLFILVFFTNNLLLSVIISRIISSTLQCYLNANFVFHKTDTPLRSAIRYFALATVMLTFNYLLIQSLVSIGIALVIAKILTETILFILSYRVQHTLVFS